MPVAGLKLLSFSRYRRAPFAFGDVGGAPGAPAFEALGLRMGPPAVRVFGSSKGGTGTPGGWRSCAALLVSTHDLVCSLEPDLRSHVAFEACRDTDVPKHRVEGAVSGLTCDVGGVVAV